MARSGENSLEMTEDRFLNGQVTLFQPKNGYRAAVDPVLLAAAVPCKPGDTVLDLGCGAGAILLCLNHRVPGVKVTGIDVQEELVVLANRNIEANEAGKTCAVIQGDVSEYTQEQLVDHVVINPPYLANDAATVSNDPIKSIANFEADGSLAEWLASAARNLKPKGRISLIHRADRVDEIIAHLVPNFGEVTLFPLWPKQGREAKRLIVTARKDVKSPARISSGLVLHRDNGGYTAEATAVLSGGTLAL